MKKLIFLLIGILLIGSLVVSAIESDMREVPLEYINPKPVEPLYLSWWEQFLNIFSRETFVAPVQYEGQTAWTTGTKFKSTTKTIYGESCAVGTYIELFACALPYSTGGTSDCQRIFQKDWRVDSSGDYLDISKACIATPSDGIINCRQRTWFTDFVNERYVGYYCNVPVSLMGAQIISSTIPSTSKVGDTITVTATVKFLAAGKYYVEAGLNKNSRQSLYGREVSLCDSSIQYDGEYFTATSGVTKSFAFNFKDYGDAAQYRIDLVVTNGCGDSAKYYATKNGIITISEKTTIVCTSGQTGTCTATNGCAGTKTCVSNAWGNCVTNLQKCSDGTCKANCGGTTPSDAPTIYSIEMVESPDKLLTKRPGDTIPLKIELRFPNGWKLSEADAIDKELKIEIGVYDYDYALSAGWIKDVPWYSRLWAVGKEAVPCVEKEAEFVNTYTFQHMASIVAIFDKCNPESDFYILEKDSCILPLEIKNIGGDLYATLPLSTSKFSDGKSNYNKEGHYVIHIGLYYDCGEYIQGDKSRYQYEMIVSRSAQDTDCTKDFTYPCPNGKVIILYYCNATTNKLGPYTYVTCDGGDGNGGDEHNKATQISLTKKQWDTASKEMVLKSTCAWYDQCIQMEGYDVACYSDDEVRSKIKNAQSAALDIANLIKTLTGLGEIKDGTCRATPVSDFDYCKFTEPLAFFSITNNKCQDGMIIIIGGIFLLLLLPKLLGDKK